MQHSAREGHTWGLQARTWPGEYDGSGGGLPPVRRDVRCIGELQLARPCQAQKRAGSTHFILRTALFAAPHPNAPVQHSLHHTQPHQCSTLCTRPNRTSAALFAQDPTAPVQHSLHTIQPHQCSTLCTTPKRTSAALPAQHPTAPVQPPHAGQPPDCPPSEPGAGAPAAPGGAAATGPQGRW